MTPSRFTKEFIEYRRVKDYYENKSHPPKWLLKLITPNRYLDFIEGLYDGSGIPFNKWVEENGYRVDGPVSECHLRGSWNEKNPAEWLTEMRIPIRRRE